MMATNGRSIKHLAWRPIGHQLMAIARRQLQSLELLPLPLLPIIRLFPLFHHFSLLPPPLLTLVSTAQDLKLKGWTIPLCHALNRFVFLLVTQRWNKRNKKNPILPSIFWQPLYLSWLIYYLILSWMATFLYLQFTIYHTRFCHFINPCTNSLCNSHEVFTMRLF